MGERRTTRRKETTRKTKTGWWIILRWISERLRIGTGGELL
jgi:hypothetical protein